MEETDDPEKDDTEKTEVVGEDYTQWEDLANKYDRLVERIDEQFGEQTKQRRHGPVMVTPPLKPTRDEWERHQLTHTPFQAWCPHCVAARAVRRKHPKKGRHHEKVPETDGGIEGPVKISMD